MHETETLPDPFPLVDGQRYCIGHYTIGAMHPQSGSNSAIYYASSDESPKKFICKWINPAKICPKSQKAEKFANIALQGCPNAVIGFDFFTRKGSQGFFMYEFTGQDLLELIRANGLLQESWIAFIIYRILVAVDWMHDIGWAHRDIKPENIFLTDGLGDIPVSYLGDFGFAAHRASRKFAARLGTGPYMAPELLTAHGYTELVDEWALGVTLYKMRTGVYPFPDSNNEAREFRSAVCDGRWDDDLIAAQGVSRQLLDLIARLLTVDPGKRLTAKNALLHDFFRLNLPEDALKAATVGQLDRALALGI
jgi:calcium/calmodulin-dependent protein kinase I